jgi:hypothetical protein
MPLVSPETTQERELAVLVQVFESGFEVTVYEVIAAPPVLLGAVQDNVTD